MPQRRAVIILCNPAKADAAERMLQLARQVGEVAEVAATGSIADTARLAQSRPHRIIVLGGDGSILAAVRAMGPLQAPIVGVNFGKLGYLAEFSVQEVHEHLPAILEDPGIISQRMMLEVAIAGREADGLPAMAVNDCVIHAGPPYRMIHLAIRADGDPLTDVSGDGLVLAAPSGTTAHNLSVGGPIVQAEICAIAISPIAPHSLTHRPLVVHGQTVIEVVAQQVNEGTTAVIDGQVSLPLHEGDRLVVRRHPHNFQLVHNPSQPRWYTLTKKLKWGQ